jgi:hypothetical protein
MRKRGIWLIDASIVGIYGAVKDAKVKDSIMTTCWNSYIKKEIDDSKPKHIIVIGYGVEKILKQSLESLEDSLGIKYNDKMLQPQGKGNTFEAFQKYQRICSKYIAPDNGLN